MRVRSLRGWPTARLAPPARNAGLRPARAALRAAHLPTPPRKHASHLGPPLNRGGDTHGPERRSPTGTRSASRCARPHPTRKQRLPPQPNAQPRWRHQQLGTPAPRHRGPEGRGRFVANPGGRTRSRAIPANEIRPAARLWRAVPAEAGVPNGSGHPGPQHPRPHFHARGVRGRTDHEHFSRWGSG